MLNDIFLSSFWGWLPNFFFGLIFLAAAFFYTRGRLERRVYLILSVIAVGFRFLYASILTLGQYFVWASDSFSRIFLRLPLDGPLPFEIARKMPWLFGGRLGYFLFYSLGRFWLNFCLVFIVSFVFWLFLQLLKKYKWRFFEEGEVELGFLAAVIVGWPGFLIFLPAAFLLVILMSLGRMVFWREKYTTLGYPFLLAVLLTLLFGQKLLVLTGLWVLKV
jgi:hypothetical protein